MVVVTGSYEDAATSLGVSSELSISSREVNKLATATGILEQYEKRVAGWDYYQLLTTSTGDLNPVPEPSAWLLLLSGVVSLAGWPLIRRRRS